MMEQHESNLRDLYAGFAMLGLIMRGASEEDIPPRAWEMAERMIEIRGGEQEGIAAIKKEKRSVRRKATDEDVR
jgi:hypothetical protein